MDSPRDPVIPNSVIITSELDDRDGLSLPSSSNRFTLTTYTVLTPLFGRQHWHQSRQRSAATAAKRPTAGMLLGGQKVGPAAPIHRPANRRGKLVNCHHSSRPAVPSGNCGMSSETPLVNTSTPPAFRTMRYICWWIMGCSFLFGAFWWFSTWRRDI